MQWKDRKSKALERKRNTCLFPNFSFQTSILVKLCLASLNLFHKQVLQILCYQLLSMLQWLQSWQQMLSIQGRLIFLATPGPLIILCTKEITSHLYLLSRGHSRSIKFRAPFQSRIGEQLFWRWIQNLGNNPSDLQMSSSSTACNSIFVMRHTGVCNNSTQHSIITC